MANIVNVLNVTELYTKMFKNGKIYVMCVSPQ